MQIKNYKDWDYTLILIALIFLIAYLTSCTTTKVVYEKGSQWSTVGKKSSMTGWKYEIK